MSVHVTILSAFIFETVILDPSIEVTLPEAFTAFVPVQGVTGVKFNCPVVILQVVIFPPLIVVIFALISLAAPHTFTLFDTVLERDTNSVFPASVILFAAIVIPSVDIFI